MNKRTQAAVGYLLIVLVALVLLQYYFAAPQSARIDYSEFKTLVRKGLVTDLIVSEERIRGTIKPDGVEAVLSEQKLKAQSEQAKEGKQPVPFDTVRVPDDAKLIAELEQSGIRYRGEVVSRWLSTLLSWVIPVGLFVLLWIYLLRRMGSGSGVMQLGKSKAKLYIEEKTVVTFADVEGINEAEEELTEVVEFLRKPEKYQRLGGRIPKGVLLIGPPGTGKTLLARAVAGRSRRTLLQHFGIRLRRDVRRRRRRAGARPVRPGGAACAEHHFHRRARCAWQSARHKRLGKP